MKYRHNQDTQKEIKTLIFNYYTEQTKFNLTDWLKHFYTLAVSLLIANWYQTVSE